MFIHKLELKAKGSEKGLFATSDISAGEVLIKFEGVELDHATRTSLQISRWKHLEGPGEIDDYLNHSCSPNCYVKDRELIASVDIVSGDEVTFDYDTTDYDMKDGFKCNCGSDNCRHVIAGYKNLSEEERSKLKHVSPWLQ